MIQMERLKSELGQDCFHIENRLEEILSAFYETMAKDTMIGFFFQGKDLKKIVNHQKNLLLMVLGYKKTYEGPPVNQAHNNIAPILKGHFHRRLTILRETLLKFELSAEAVSEWVQFEGQFEAMVVK